MVKTEQMTNAKIYELANLLISSFSGDLILPVKVSFYLQKNMAKIIEMGREIEQIKMDIFNKYGELDESGEQYTFSEENAIIANQELKDLMDIVQEVSINTLTLDLFENIELSNKQIAAISFMIEE